jgi:hypothetical protein
VALDAWRHRMAACVMRLLLLTLLLSAFLFGCEAMAHEAHNGWSYPFECCGGHDCSSIDDKRVSYAPGGYLVDGLHFVAQKDVRQSPDGQFHACFPQPNNLRCFFAPPNGS